MSSEMVTGPWETGTRVILLDSPPSPASFRDICCLVLLILPPFSITGPPDPLLPPTPSPAEAPLPRGTPVGSGATSARAR
ncbi:hypothetical protein GDO78_013869 [Eleutherodactylus coqui]|uniref:Uncharacterized protein n=1 Tax=Eleutherodactylus coqui TaxID=57060 RepID=A0A8J6BH79_ELECQ|nr:hypothetical protein GDO78_013869 [Eleutherodactylus coqui]